jgi:hypothetical protein
MIGAFKEDTLSIWIPPTTRSLPRNEYHATEVPYATHIAWLLYRVGSEYTSTFDLKSKHVHEHYY